MPGLCPNSGGLWAGLPRLDPKPVLVVPKAAKRPGVEWPSERGFAGKPAKNAL